MDVASLIDTLPERPDSLDEAYDLVVTLWRLVQDLREQLGLNSQNSSRPPSQDRLSGKNKERARRPASDKKRGAQPGHVQHTRETAPEAEVNQVLRHFPDAHCPCGGAVIIDTEPKERHQVFDLPEITYTVTEHQCFGGTCPCCRRQTVAQLPQDVPSSQMGPGLIAWIALMSGHFRLSTRSIQTLLEMQWSLKFSTGAISEAQAPVADWLAPLHEHIGDTLRQAPVAHADETTHFQGAQRHWLWVLCTPQLAFFLVHASRGMKAARELLGAFAGVLITDRRGLRFTPSREIPLRRDWVNRVHSRELRYCSRSGRLSCRIIGRVCRKVEINWGESISVAEVTPERSPAHTPSLGGRPRDAAPRRLVVPAGREEVVVNSHSDRG